MVITPRLEGEGLLREAEDRPEQKRSPDRSHDLPFSEGT